MARDRLKEFRQRAGLGEEADGGTGDARGGGGGGGVVPYSATDGGTVSIDMELLERQDEMGRFFQQIEDLRKLIEDIKEDVKNVKNHHSEILSTPIPDEKKKQELDALMSTVKTSSQVIRSKLKDMEKGIHQEMDQLGEEPMHANLRIRKTQHSALLRDFVDVMNEYQKAQVEYRDRCKGRIKRQLEITNANFTDQEVENMIEEGNFSVFTQSIMIESEQQRQMLADVEARHNDILKLEKSLKELHDLFLEMALLVESQGEVVDRIENQVLSTVDYTEKAREQLKSAEKLQTAARKKKIWIIIFLIVVAIILFIIIYFSV